MSSVTLELILYLIPSILFLPVGYLLLRQLIRPDVDTEGHQLPHVATLLMFLTLLVMIGGWVFTIIRVFLR
ncbi:hypothetical protein KKF05_00785 [Patescibacteria group bacterium]|nr:hypothetical protein [Patescibacteria group bacterium]MBU1916116.1 hypothetical protein [Patescibacteria group bacterium]